MQRDAVVGKRATQWQEDEVMLIIRTKNQKGTSVTWWGARENKRDEARAIFALFQSIAV